MALGGMTLYAMQFTQYSDISGKLKTNNELKVAPIMIAALVSLLTTMAKRVLAASWDEIHQYFNNFSICFLSFF
jgi:hypothetical protein